MKQGPMRAGAAVHEAKHDNRRYNPPISLERNHHYTMNCGNAHICWIHSWLVDVQAAGRRAM